MFKIISNLKNINKYLLIISVILIILLLIIIIFYLNEKNTNVQKYLENIQEKLNINKNVYSKIINPNHDVIYENNVIIVNDFLTKYYFEFIKKNFNNKEFESRDFLVRKASGINFQKLHESEYKDLLEIYYSNHILDFLSKIIKKPVQRISLGDPNACSLLIYSKKGDHINWHYDYSNYYGDRYVVLLTLVNENAKKDGGLSQNIFQYNYEGKIYDLKMKENSIVIFKGSEILHKSSAIDDNEIRILLSMVYCDICQEKKNVFNIIYESTKNYIVYGN
jgi:hypothetical protein